MLGRSLAVIARITIGRMTSARAAIFIAALISAFSVCPQETLKLGLGFTIGPRSMAAAVTGARGIPRVYPDHRNTSNDRFVDNKGWKLKERPTAMFSPTGFPNRCPVADLCKFLKGDTASGVFGFLDQVFRNNVVSVTTKQRLFTANPPKMSSRQTGVTGLQALAKAVVAVSGVLNSFTRKAFAFRVSSYPGNAQVYTDCYENSYSYLDLNRV